MNFTSVNSLSRKAKLELAGMGLVFSTIAAAILVPSLGRTMIPLTGNTIISQTPLARAEGPGAWWDNIGGCGVGGGGGGGGSARWMGRGVTGGLLNLDVMSTTTIAGDYEYKSLSARLSKNMGRLSLGATLPWVMKEGTHQFRTDAGALPTTQRVGGMGNLGVDLSCKFGEIQSASATISAGLPTAQHNHRRYYASDDNFMKGQSKDGKYFVPPELQTGNGLYSGTVGLDYTIDRDWGPIALGVSYTSNFRTPADLAKMGAQNELFERSPTNPNRYMDFPGSDAGTLQEQALYAAYKDIFHAVDASGEDLGELIGDYYGNSAAMHLAVAYKEESFVHSLQFDYSYKLSKDWYVRDDMIGTPTANALTLERSFPVLAAVSEIPHFFNASYGLEFSHMYFPVFLAGTMGFNTKEIVNYTGTIGVKGSFF